MSCTILSFCNLDLEKRKKKRTGRYIKIKILLIVIDLSYGFMATAQEENFDNEYSETKKKANPMHANGFNYISFGAEVGPIAFHIFCA